MDAPKKLIVGYDLCEDFSQISCYSYKSMEPITLSVGKGDDSDCPIPTALCVKTDTKQWLFGEEAIDCAKSGEGILVDHLLTKIRTGETIELYQTEFTGVALLEKFMRKSLTLIKSFFPTEPISKLVVTIRDTEPLLVEKILEALALLGIGKDRVVVMSHASAYLYYALCQDRSLWMNDVGLFDYNETGLYYHQIHFNRRVKPMIAALTKNDLSSNLDDKLLKQKNNNIAYIFENAANTVLYKQIVTTLYITGSGFEGGWADGVLKNLCAGRRVFSGQNLYSKGACFAAKEMSGDQSIGDVFLLNDDMVTTSISVKVYCDTRFKEITMVEAGDIWYEVNKSLEVIPEGKAELDITLNNIMTRACVREKLLLNQFPERPDRTTRLAIHFSCKDKSTAIIKVTDLGFGEFFPETGVEMIFSLEI